MFVFGYRALQSLDPNFQNLFLFELLLDLCLHRMQDLNVLGLDHLDVFKLQREKTRCTLERRVKGKGE